MVSNPVSSLGRFLRGFYTVSDSTPSQRILRACLVPLVPAYKLVRYGHQTWRRFRRRALSCPVVSVGNLSLGGTGKTAFVRWLVTTLCKRNLRPAVLTRGTGSETGLLVEPSDDDLAVLADRFGDEPALLHRTCPDVPIGVGANRYRQGRALLADHEVDVVILDDGFQRRNLHRDLDVVLLGSIGELDAWELPAGPLREPVGALDRADFVSLNVTAGGTDSSSRLREVFGRSERVLTHAYVFRGVYRQDREITDELRRRPVDVVTTLARPGALLEVLREAGFQIRRHDDRPDHASLDSEWLESRFDLDRLLVTRKEWVKLPPRIRRRVGCVISELRVKPTKPLLETVEARVGTVLSSPGEADTTAVE